MNFKIRTSKLVLKIVNFAVKMMSNLIKMYRIYTVCPYKLLAINNFGSHQERCRTGELENTFNSSTTLPAAANNY